MRNWIMTGIFLSMTFGFLSGCTSVSTKREFADVQEQIAARTKGSVGWSSPGDDRSTEERIQLALECELTADAAVEIAFMNNPSLQAEFEELGIAKADLVQAGLLKNPSLTGSFREPDHDGKTNTEFEVKQDILGLFTLPLRKRLAREQLERVKYAIGAAVLNLDKEVRAAFYTLQAAGQMLSMQEKITQATQAAIQLAERQIKAGNINDLALTGYQLAFQQARMDLAQSKLEVGRAHEELGRLLGLSKSQISWDIAQGLPYISEDEPSREMLEAKAIAQNFDLAMARQQVKIMEKQTVVSRVNMVPEIKGGYNTEREPDGGKLSGPVFEAEIPIFDQKQTGVAGAKARLEQSKRNLAAKEDEVVSQVRTSYAKLLTTREMIETYRETVIPLHEKFIDSLQKHYNYMLVGVYDLLNAKKEEIEAYHKFVDALKDYWITRSELEHLAGERFAVVPTDTSLPEINPEPVMPQQMHHQGHGGK